MLRAILSRIGEGHKDCRSLARDLGITERDLRFALLVLERKGYLSSCGSMACQGGPCFLCSGCHACQKDTGTQPHWYELTLKGRAASSR